jgi:hypothetical protein
MSDQITIKKKTLYAGIGSIFFILSIIVSLNIFTVDSVNAKSLEEKFKILNNANSNSCGGTFNYVDSMPGTSRIQGSCCSKMNFHRYSEQIEGLKEYKKYKIIPADPYDVSVSLAKELLDYQKNIILTSEQQEIYDYAVGLSDEGGPCCCKCWHWYAYEGLAKYLIVEDGFTAEQIAEVWDLSDACGGSGHVEGGGH